MTVKSIVKLACIMLKKECAIKYLETGEVSGDALETVNALTSCVSLTVNELACSYIPLIKEESVDGSEKIAYSSLSENPLKILSILDDSGREIDFTQTAEFITCKKSANKIKYSYSPSNFNLEDITGYNEADVPARVIAYGVCAEYCLTIRAFSESVTFHKRYTESLEEIVLPRSFRIKGRAFN